MFNFNTILRELKDIPSNRLEELYQFVHSLNLKVKKSDTQRKKILAFAGIFADLNTADYSDLKRETKKTRITLFNRKFE